MEQGTVEGSPLEFFKDNRIFFEKLNGPENRLFLAAINKRNTSGHSLGKHSKRSMNGAGENAKISLVPAVFIMVAGEIHFQGIFGISRIIFTLYTIQCKRRSIPFGYAYHHMKHVPGINGVKPTLE